MANYVYDLMEAHYNGIKSKPWEIIKELGFDVIKWEANPIFEKIFFRTTNEIDNLPEEIGKLPDDYKFADEIDKGAI